MIRSIAGATLATAAIALIKYRTRQPVYRVQGFVRSPQPGYIEQPLPANYFLDRRQAKEAATALRDAKPGHVPPRVVCIPTRQRRYRQLAA